MGLSVVHHRLSVGSAQGLHLGGEPSTEAFHGCLARLDQQFAVPVPANSETQEIKPCIEADNAGLGLVEGQTPGRQPPGQPVLHRFGLFPADTHDDQIIGVPDHHRGVRHRSPARAVRRGIAGPCGLLDTVQSNVQQRRADHPTLRGSLLGRGELFLLDHTGGQPLPDLFPCGKQAELVSRC